MQSRFYRKRKKTLGENQALQERKSFRLDVVADREKEVIRIEYIQ